MKRRRCNLCPNEDKEKRMKRLNGEWLCKKCYSERRKEKRSIIRDSIKTKNRRWAKKPDEEPKIKGVKEKKVSNRFHFYLTREEKKLLYKKYLSQGLDSESADKKIKRDIEFLDDLVIRLRKEIKDEELVGIRFKEEFAKLI
jgi:hypothetical protein